jgi:sirohydrochlorin ferrochelatase
MKTAVIILGHGSRGGGDDSALRRIVEEVRRSGGKIIEYAFLQYSQPSADAALERCIEQGAKEIVIVPFFLQAGVHVMKDVPAFLEKAKGQHPTVEIRMSDPVGTHPLMAKIVADLARGIEKDVRSKE